MCNNKPIAPSISKDTFCKALSLIREQEKEHDLVQKALCIVTDGPMIFTGSSKYYEALMLVLKEGINDKFNNIEWWLYDGPESGYIVSDEKTQQSWDLTEAAALYDYIRNECQ